MQGHYFWRVIFVTWSLVLWIHCLVFYSHWRWNEGFHEPTVQAAGIRNQTMSDGSSQQNQIDALPVLAAGFESPAAWSVHYLTLMLTAGLWSSLMWVKVQTMFDPLVSSQLAAACSDRFNMSLLGLLLPPSSNHQPFPFSCPVALTPVRVRCCDTYQRLFAAGRHVVCWLTVNI